MQDDVSAECLKSRERIESFSLRQIYGETKSGYLHVSPFRTRSKN